MAHLAKRDGHLKAPVSNPLHGDIEPIPAEGRFIPPNAAKDFRSCDTGMADIGSQPGTPFFGMCQGQGKGPGVAPKHQNACSGFRILNDGV